ncbi:MAG: sulfotransferase family 2 domain-containing protein [Aliishimia sp.]
MKAVLTDLYRAYMPTVAREAIMMRRRSALWQARGVVFIHVPKCAGSSVNDALYGRFMGHISADVIKRFGSADVKVVPSFSLLRDPMSRAISAYRFVQAGVGTGSGVVATVRKPERYDIPEFKSFDAFVQDWLPKQTLSKCDPVFRTQTSYVCAKSGAVLVDHLGSTADMTPTIAWLYDTLGRTVAIGRTNVTARGKSSANIVASPESRSILELVYRSDFELFNTRA